MRVWGDALVSRRPTPPMCAVEPAYALPLASSPAVSSCPVAVPIASAEKWIVRAHEGNPAWCQTQTSQRGRFPTTCCCSVFTFQLFTVWAVAPMASRSSLERTLPRGLVLDVAAFATGFRWLMHRGYTL